MSRGSYLILVALALLALGSAAYPENTFDSLYDGAIGPVGDFRFTNQHGRPVSLDDLKGKVWVASFFFSTCKECSKHQHNLTDLQHQLDGWPDVMIISFSIDPDKDTPAQLELFARNYHAAPNRWQFLTGPRDEMHTLIKTSFGQGVEDNPEKTQLAEYIHEFRYMVVDHRGKIRGYVDGRDPAEVERLGERVKKLVQAKYLPGINATLNGLAGIMLVLGYLAVRRRWIGVHQYCMRVALAFSAIFLGCYLYYHFLILDGRPTLFSGEGWVRSLYFGILLSHTVLAVIVAPLAITTAAFGELGGISRHRRLARWTLPLWLYVSVTGVLVYWMLYHLYPPL